MEAVHQPAFPQSLTSLSEYRRLHDGDDAQLQLPDHCPSPYRTDVGHALRFDSLHPPVLPRIDREELGSGDYDRLMEDCKLDPSQLVDPTNRTPAHSLRFAEDIGYATAARASLLVFVSALAPAADVRALGSVEVDVERIPEGVTRTVMWRGKPVFIRHRTAHEVQLAKRDDELARQGLLRHPQLDEERVKREEFLVVVGICTHLGCVPLSNAGDYHGFFCPCHGSHYDTSARVRKGPAPLNLEVPPYDFVRPFTVKLGTT